MKKIVISLAGVLAATAFAPEAAAVPAFARQVGMGCTACHAQHFPVLNSFGRAFKAGGYTMMGAQGKIEGDHLSIPDTLNASIVLKVRHQKDNTPGVTGSKTSQPQALGDGEWQFPDEFALLFGGRVAETIGFLLEGNMIGSPLAAGFKMPVVFDMGAVKVSVIPFITDALSAQYGYEQSSGGVMRSNRWSEHRRETSAIQYNADRGGDGGSATGAALVVANDMGYVNVTKYAANFGGGSTWGSTYLRVAATPTVADWAMVVGLGRMSGQSYSAAATAAVQTEQTFADLQMQGEVAGRELGVYAQYAKAPSGSGGLKNAYNGSTNTANPDRKAMTIGADFSVVPHVLTVGAAYRKAETGGAAATNGDDAMTFTVVYDLYQNVALHLNYSAYSGTAHDAVNAQKNLRTLMLESAW
ncbi:MAG: hypothetical protein Q7T21_01430 [Gallionella sp.]|nr:hypothetical protein [Gallionella sp.]